MWHPRRGGVVASAQAVWAERLAPPLFSSQLGRAGGKCNHESTKLGKHEREPSFCDKHPMCFAYSLRHILPGRGVGDDPVYANAEQAGLMDDGRDQGDLLLRIEMGAFPQIPTWYLVSADADL